MRKPLAILLTGAALAAGPVMAKDLAFVVADCAIAAGAKTISYVTSAGSDRPVKEQVSGIKFHRKMKLSAEQEKQIKACILTKAGG